MRKQSIDETFFILQKKRLSSEYGFYVNLPKYNASEYQTRGGDYTSSSSSISDTFAVWYSAADKVFRGISFEAGFKVADDYHYDYFANSSMLHCDSSDENSTEKYGSLTILTKLHFPGLIRASVSISRVDSEGPDKYIRSVNDSIKGQWNVQTMSSVATNEYELGYVLQNYNKSILTYIGGAIGTERAESYYSSLLNKGFTTRFEAFHSRKSGNDFIELYYAAKGVYQATFNWKDYLGGSFSNNLFDSISWKKSNIDAAVSLPIIISIAPVNKFTMFFSFEPIFNYSKIRSINYEGIQETKKASSIDLNRNGFGMQLKPNSNLIIRIVPAIYAFPVKSFEIYYYF